MSETPKARLRRRRAVPRQALLRLLSLLLGLLLLALQQPIGARELLAASGESRVSEPSQSVEHQALRAPSAPRVARAPVLARLPPFVLPVTRATLFSPPLLIARAGRGARAQLVVHFHAKRRIPRMNSEEPPRVCDASEHPKG